MSKTIKNELNNEYNNKDAIDRDIRSSEKDEIFNIYNSTLNKRLILIYTYEHVNVFLIRKIFRKTNIATIMISNVNKINILQHVFGEQINFNHLY